MTPDAMARKHRLRYLVDVYFPHLKYADLHRRIAGQQPPDDARGLYRIAEQLLLKPGEQWHGPYRTFATYFEAPPKPAPPDPVVTALSLALARDYLNSNVQDKDAAFARELGLKQALVRYINKGDRGPFAILRSVEMLGQELDFEYLLPLSQETPADTPFAKLAALQSYPTANRFLQGDPPDDWAVLRHVAIERECERELLTALKGGKRLILVTGAAGDGKTTMLKRVGMSLRETGWRVFYWSAPVRAVFPKLPSFSDRHVQTVILVDNADMATDFPELAEDVKQNSHVHVVLCSRAYNWDRKDFNIGRVSTIQVPRLSEKEVKQLAATIVQYGAAGQKVTQDEVEDRISTSVASDHPHLLAAMLSATRGKSFQDIIKDLIHDFEKAGEDWVLRFVACGALLNDVSDDRLSRLPEQALLACVRGRYQSDARGRASRDDVHRQLARFSSEVIPVRVSKPGMTEYDLRHPDIWREVLSHFYGFDEREITRPQALADDLCEIGQDEISAALPRLPQWHGRFRPYIARVAQFLLRRGYNRHSFPLLVEQTLVGALITYLGNFPKERELKSTLRVGWGTAEAFRAQDLRRDFDTKRWLHAQVVIPRQTESYPEPAQEPRAAEVNSPVSSKTLSLKPPQRSGVVRQVFSHGRSKHVVVQVVKSHVPNEKIDEQGSRHDDAQQLPPPPATDALSVNQEQRALPAERLIWNPFYDIGLEEIEEAERLSSELFEGALSDYSEGKDEIWISWIKARGAGVTQSDASQEPIPVPSLTRQELCRRAWRAGVRDSRLRNIWFDTELAHRNIGDAVNPNEFSARWISRQDNWIEVGPSIDPNFINHWIDLELKDNVCSFTNAPLNTARWIFRWAWERSFRGPAFLIKWLELEKRDGNIDREIDWSVRDICKRAWAAGVRHTKFVLWWIEFECEYDNLGESVNPTAYSARWVYRQAWNDCKPDLEFVTRCAELEEEQDNIGDVDNPSDFSVRWIYRHSWRISDSHFKLLFQWFLLENLEGNIGDSETQYTASWIDDLIASNYSSLTRKEIITSTELQPYTAAGGKLKITLSNWRPSVQITPRVGVSTIERTVENGPDFEPLSGPRGAADDLKRLTGVSPAIEKSLNDLGLFHYWQIAALTADAVRIVGDEVGLSGRVGLWITEAKELAAE